MPENPPPEIQSLIDAHVDAFNAQNVKLFLSVFADDAIIIGGIAPYRWLNPTAPMNWLDDVEKWREDLGVSHEHLAYEMGVLERRGLLCLRGDRGDAHGDRQGPNCGSNRNPRLYVFKARRRMEDRRAGVGPHVVVGLSLRPLVGLGRRRCVIWRSGRFSALGFVAVFSSGCAIWRSIASRRRLEPRQRRA